MRYNTDMSTKTILIIMFFYLLTLAVLSLKAYKQVDEMQTITKELSEHGQNTSFPRKK